MASSLGSMPVLTACAPMSPSTASICARTKAAGTGCTFGREASGMGEAGGAREGSRLVRCSRRVRGSRGESEAAKIEEAGESGKSSSAGGGDEERGGGQGCTAWTPRVFWAVSATSAVVPNTPSASQALRSAWIPAAEAQGRSQPLAGQLCASAWQRTPAPPPESEPATVSITGAAEPATPDTSSESAARNDGSGIFRKGRKTTASPPPPPALPVLGFDSQQGNAGADPLRRYRRHRLPRILDGVVPTHRAEEVAVGVEATRSVQLAAERRLRRRRPQLGRALRSDSERVGAGVVFFLSF